MTYTECVGMETPEPDIVPNADKLSLVDTEDRLDELWEIYLGLLDKYTKAQHEIQKSMASGFYSLARAQSGAPFGRRYGQDWYDERMKALQRVEVSDIEADSKSDSLATGMQSLKFSVVSGDSTESAKESVTEESKTEAENEIPAQEPSPPTTPEPEQTSENTKPEEPEDDQKPRIRNPLRWYGILVPPELKRAQASFTATLQSPDKSDHADESAYGHSLVADAVNAAREMRTIEVEIRKTRKIVRKAEKAKAAT